MAIESSEVNIAFIINPISGISQKKKIRRQIPKIFGDGNFKYTIVETEYEGHAIDLASEMSKNHDIVVAVGGDGTLNEVVRGILNTDTKLGIVPCGSGNGLARHLKISLNSARALKAIKNGQEHSINTIMFNGKPFINVSGIGFDALVAHKFAESARRGIWSYFKNTIRVYFGFKPIEVTITIENQTFERKALLVTFANSSQFGYNATISPISDVSDGAMEVCILKPFSFFKSVIVVAARLFTKRMHKSKHLEIIRTKKVSIITKTPVASHIDGSPYVIDTRFEVEINKKSITAIF
ncbi:MAG: diacylglycerol/lipid kinase family protein [Salinivirgaceae bacterium]|jgi:diacylglycerol kinase (ATP)|nr:diacylglycerol kinase family lipid kinase [Bacteroidales bacterium]